MNKEKIVSIIHRNSHETSNGLVINYEDVQKVIAELSAIGEDDSESTKSDYEILSFRSSIESVIWELKDGHYHSIYSKIGQSLSLMLKSVEKNAAVIHSVRRLSDNEVFTEGGSFRDGKNNAKILKIKIIDGKMILFDDQGSFGELMKIVTRVAVPTVLITTEDGKEVTNGDYVLYGVGEFFGTFSVLAKTSRHNNHKYFSTEAARNEYVLHNKPIKVTLRELVLDAGVSRSRYETYKEFFKLKQK